MGEDSQVAYLARKIGRTNFVAGLWSIAVSTVINKPEFENYLLHKNGSMGIKSYLIARCSHRWTRIIVDLRINDTRQTGAVG